MNLIERLKQARAARAARRDWRAKAEHWRETAEFWESAAAHRARRIQELHSEIRELRRAEA